MWCVIDNHNYIMCMYYMCGNGILDTNFLTAELKLNSYVQTFHEIVSKFTHSLKPLL